MGRDLAGRGRTPALAALTREGVRHVVHPYEHDPRAESYGLEAAQALGVEPARVFKTLMASLDGELVVGIVPVSGRLDLKALARALGGRRAELAPVADAERATGYVAGGISPLGQRRACRTALDASALDHATILVSAGRRGLDVELDPRDLLRLTDATTADLTR